MLSQIRIYNRYFAEDRAAEHGLAQNELTGVENRLSGTGADGFEAGNFSVWSANKIGSGDLSVTPVAALTGTKGMQAVIDDNVAIFLTSDPPNAEPRYRARFYFDPNSITIVSGNAHIIFNALMGTSTTVMRVEFRYSSGAYQIRGGLINDGTAWSNTSWVTISDAAHPIEVDWSASTAAGANNGGLTLRIDGTQQATRTGMDNDARRIDGARLGAVTGIDSGTRGTYYFDAFESRRQAYINCAVVLRARRGKRYYLAMMAICIKQTCLRVPLRDLR